MKPSLRDGEYLTHIQDAILKIHRYLAGKTEADFLDDGLLQDGTIRNLEIIGEAVSKLSPELKSAYDEVPWSEISGMRNRLIHGYMSVNLHIVWDTIEKVLPEFLAKVKEIKEG